MAQRGHAAADVSVDDVPVTQSVCRTNHREMMKVLLIAIGIATTVLVAAVTITAGIYWRLSDRADMAVQKAEELHVVVAENKATENQHWEAHTRQITGVRTAVDELQKKQAESDKIGEATKAFRETTTTALEKIDVRQRDIQRAVDRLVLIHDPQFKDAFREPEPAPASKSPQ